MLDRIDRIASLTAKFIAGIITPEEQRELQAWIDLSPDNRRLFEERMQPEQIRATMEERSRVDDERVWGKILHGIRGNYREEDNRRIAAMPRRRWVWPAAAAILLLLSLSWLLMSRYHIKKGDAGLVSVKRLAAFRKAVGDAILILGDNKPISLELQELEQAVHRSGFVVIRTGKQAFVLQHMPADNNSVDKSSTVLLSVPYGQSLDLTLPDGTYVKLGPGAVLSMPVQTKDQRNLLLDGEAYFQVARDEKRPFKLSTPQGDIDVLGTSFNVRSFSDDPGFTTTLISGKVKVSAEGAASQLLPGEEASFVEGLPGIRVMRGVDTTDRLAWRSPYFNFTDLNIPAVMQQVERWYGLKNIVYRPGVDTVTKGLLGGGHIGKDISLHRLLEKLEENHVSFSIHDKTIIVGPMVYTSLAYMLYRE